MKKSKMVTLGAAVVTLALLSGCGGAKAPSKEKNAQGGGAAAEAPVFAVNTSTAARGLISDYLALSGDIVAASTVDTLPEVAGKVRRLYVSVGDRVNRNQPLADIDPSRPGMEYEVNVVRAPVSGIVVALPASIGMTVSQAVSVARIAAGNALEIKLYAAERFVSRLRQGQPCEIALDAYPGETFQGTVTELSPVVDPASRTLEVTVGLGNSGARLRAGMFAKVKIITERKPNVVKIPASAMVQRFGENYVFTVEQDPANSGFVARKAVITPGIVIDGIMEVEEGLAAGAEFVTRGQSLLEDGSRINVIERTPPLN
ncbi:MAG: efflux RND transporter periplasmic adaptor subunit [Treponematales bacterium]